MRTPHLALNYMGKKSQHKFLQGNPLPETSLQPQGGRGKSRAAVADPLVQLLPQADAPAGLGTADEHPPFRIKPLHHPARAPDDTGKIQRIGTMALVALDDVPPGLAP